MKTSEYHIQSADCLKKQNYQIVIFLISAKVQKNATVTIKIFKSSYGSSV